MKKVLVLFALVAIAFTGCKKSSDSSPTYTKSQFIGKWKQTTPASAAGVTDFLLFTDTKITIGSEGSGSSGTMGPIDYTFDGKVIKYNMVLDVINTINELTTTKLVLTMTYTGVPGSTQYTYTKMN